MKLLITLLLLLNVHSILSYDDFVLFDMSVGNLYNINATTGSLISTSKTFEKHMYFIDGCLGGNNGNIYFISSDVNSSPILEYNIKTNTYTAIAETKNGKPLNTGFQQFAYDPVNNFAAIPGTTQNAWQFSPLVINFWDLNAKHFDIINVPDVSVNVYEGTFPIGTYDQNTGNYYIEYYLEVSNTTHIVVYNLLSNKIVGNHTIENFQLTENNILFTEGQLYLVDTNLKESVDFYLIDLTYNSYKKVLSIPSQYHSQNPLFGVLAQKDSTAIVMTESDKVGEYIFTKVDLLTMSTSTSPVSKLSLQGVPQIAVAL